MGVLIEIVSRLKDLNSYTRQEPIGHAHNTDKPVLLWLAGQSFAFIFWKYNVTCILHESIDIIQRLSVSFMYVS